MLREAFYYLLGGVTFLPICALALLIHFYWNAPSARRDAPLAIDADVDLSHEKKLAALDLAAQNAATHAEIEKSKGKDHPQGDATAPPTAKRIGPGPANASTAPQPHLAGWLVIRSTFESDKDNAPANSASSAPATIPAKLVDAESDASRVQSDDEHAPIEGTDTADAVKSNATAAGSGYMSQMYRGILDYRIGRTANKKPAAEANAARSANASPAPGSTPTGTAGRENFYCILKSPILYLYSSDDVANPNTECHAAIDLRAKRVSIFVAGLGDTLADFDVEQLTGLHADEQQLGGDDSSAPAAFDAKQAWRKAKRAGVRDGELFMKRNAIRVVGSAYGRSASPGDRKAARASHLGRRRPQWYIFCKNNYFMEDWYHALLQASLQPDSSMSAKLPDDASSDVIPDVFSKVDGPIGSTFSQHDMASLLVSLDSLPDPLPLRWLNALVGRIFFSVYRTAWLENYIISKMMKKINRVKTPGFLGDIKVVEVDVGRRAPGFSRPMLKALTSEGEASMEIAVHYVGEVRITISTTLTLSLGSRFKPYTIPIVLAVVLRSLEGNLLLHVKRPPSNRLWFGFTTMPKMEIDIEPVVSERKVQWGMVTRLIEGRLKELLNESIVVPNMDDISFFDTRSLPFRGGIFADAAKKADALGGDVAVSDPSSAAANAAKTASQAERDSKSVPTSTKSSDLPAANKVGTVSAPVSGTATPHTPDRQSAIPSRNGFDEDAEASSISAGVSTSADLRNRKAVGEATALARKEALLQTARTSSPAAAGLSDLLSRDLAAGGGSSNTIAGSPPRQDSQSSKRRTWFGSGSKSSMSSVSSSSGLSTLGLSAAALGGRSGREQSSLALGNASIERPSQRSNSANVSGRKDSTLSAMSAPDAGSVRAASDSVRPNSAEKSASDVRGFTNPPALTSDSEDAPGSFTVARTASRDLEEAQKPAEPDRRSGAPSLIISSASEPKLATSDAAASEPSPATMATLHTPSTRDADEDQDVVESPSSLSHSTRSSLRSFRSDAVSSQPSRDVNNDLSGPDGKARASDASDVVHAIEAAKAPPPPPRRPTSSAKDELATPRQDAASLLSSVQRGRYGLNDTDRSAGEESGALAGSTSAMLLTSWNRAKASMADKESRQAAARDAKDAIKRGWANWNSKRADAKRMSVAGEELRDQSEYDGMSRSQSSRLSLVPGKSAWLASSPPDPTSFGLGFDKASPENVRSRGSSTAASFASRPRSSATDTDDDNASMHSNSSSRQPYRELRAAKKVHGFDSASGEARASSASSSNLASTQSSSRSTSRTNTSTGDGSAWTAQWDAEVPTLTPPIPAAFRNDRAEEGSPESKRKALERTTSNDLPNTFTPPALPQRKPSSSVSSTGQSSGVVSFIPPAPSTTTEVVAITGPPAASVSAARHPSEGQTDELSTSESSDRQSSVQPQIHIAKPDSPERPLLESPGAKPVDAPASPARTAIHRESSSSSLKREASRSSSTTPDAHPLSSGDTAKPSSDGPNTAKDVCAGDASASATLTGAKSDESADQPWSAASPEVSSPILGSGIKQQPGRATMMAVPGIPSMQKAGPQSFSAPPPPEPTSDAETSPSAFRASSLFKMPAFGSPVLTSGARRASGSASEASASAAEKTAPPPVPARPKAEPNTTALGLSQMDEPAKAKVTPPVVSNIGDKASTESEQPDHGADASFADVAGAEGPAVDPDFERAQFDAGATVQLGNREIKLPAGRESNRE